MTDREALKLALEALEEAQAYTSCESFSPSMTNELAICAAKLRQALEQPDAIEAAVLTEREACANVAARISDKYAFGFYGNEVDTADEIAAAIRERMK